MAKGKSAILISIMISVLPVGQAHAARICAWIVESNQVDDVRQLDLWLQSDADINIVFQPVAIVDVEVEQLACEQGARQRRTRSRTPHQFV